MQKFPARLLRPRLEKPTSRWVSQPTPSYERIKNSTKDIEVRRDLGNRASPVNRAHMKKNIHPVELVSIANFTPTSEFSTTYIKGELVVYPQQTS